MRDMWPKDFTQGILRCETSSLPLPSCIGSVWRWCLSITFGRHSWHYCESIAEDFFLRSWNSFSIFNRIAWEQCRRQWKRPWKNAITEFQISVVGLASQTNNFSRCDRRKALHVASETTNSVHTGHLLPGNVWFKPKEIFLNECESRPSALYNHKRESTGHAYSYRSPRTGRQSVPAPASKHSAHFSQFFFIFFLLLQLLLNLCFSSVNFVFSKSLLRRVDRGYLCVCSPLRILIVAILP